MGEILKNIYKSFTSLLILYILLFLTIYLGLEFSYLISITISSITVIFLLYLWINKSDKAINLKNKIIGTELWIYLIWILGIFIFGFFTIVIITILGLNIPDKFSEIFTLMQILVIADIAILARWRVTFDTIDNALDSINRNQKVKTPKFSKPIKLVNFVLMTALILIISTIFIISFG